MIFLPRARRTLAGWVSWAVFAVNDTRWTVQYKNITNPIKYGIKSFLFFFCRAATLVMAIWVSKVKLAIIPRSHICLFFSFSLTILQILIERELKLLVSAVSNTTLRLQAAKREIIGGRNHLLRSGATKSGGSRVVSHSSRLEHTPAAWGASGVQFNIKSL